MSTGTIISLIGLVVVLLGYFAQAVRVDGKVADLAKWREKVDAHMEDREIHLDPRRDEQRWNDLATKLDKMERKLDGLIQLEKRRGDSGNA